jgi:hypothetical protein
MARLKQTARRSSTGPAPPRRPLTPAQQKKYDAEQAKIEAALDGPAMRKKLTEEFAAKVLEIQRTFDLEREAAKRELEYRLAQQRLELAPAAAASSSASAACSSTDESTPVPCIPLTRNLTSDRMQIDLSPDEERRSSDLDLASQPAASSSPAAASSSPSVPSPSLDVSTWSRLDTRLSPFPSDWPTNQSHHVTLTHLTKESDDWKRIERMVLTSGLPKANILAIQRIFNRPLWVRYFHAREQLMKKYGNEQVNTPQSCGGEKLMFHGSRSTAPHLIYSQADGFDVRCANSGMLGAGMYFSSSSAYSGTSYAHPLNPLQNYGYKVTAPVIPPIWTTQTTKKKPSKNALAAAAGGAAAAAGAAASSSVTVMKAKAVPQGTSQMFIARVALGTEYDVKKNGNQHYSNRPPLRPFHCTACSKKVDLDAINIEVLKDDMMKSAAKMGAIVEEVLEVEESKQQETEETSTKGRAAPKRRRASTLASVWMSTKKRKAKSPPAASAAAVDEEQKDDTAMIDVAASSGSAAAASSSDAAFLSCDEHPVACPHCKIVLGTRAALLSTPYRYDSVTSDHMSVTYESDRAYPEYLITFQANQ